VVVLVLVQRLLETNEVCRDQFGTLMNELKKGMLRVGSWLSPNDGSGLVANWFAIAANALAVAFHDTLLQVRRQFLQILGIRYQGFSLGPIKVVVPNTQERHNNWHVLLKRRVFEMRIHLLRTLQELLKIVGANP
jgi:hypothetical protein